MPLLQRGEAGIRVAAIAALALLALAACGSEANDGELDTTPVASTVERAVSRHKHQESVPTLHLGVGEGILDATPSPTVTLAPTPLPVVQEPAGDAPEWAIEIICAPEYQWPCEEALSVAWCESRFRADAINWWTGTPQEGDGVFGILQVALPLHADLLAQYGAWDDPVANVAAAYQLYTARDSTWSHWAWECRPY